jgi:hypothetical protein
MRLCLGFDCNRASNLLATEGHDFRNLLEGLLIKDKHLAVRTIHKYPFLCLLRQMEPGEDQTQVLGHFVAEAHLDEMPDVCVFVAYDKLRYLLVTHIGRPIDFDAELLYVA